MKRVEWNRLDVAGRKAVLERPVLQQTEGLGSTVSEIIRTVRRDGDRALARYTRTFDGCDLQDTRVSDSELESAAACVPDRLKRAIANAMDRIETFHRATTLPQVRAETAPGVVCERMLRPINCVGLYVPAGTAPLVSTLMMLGVPAGLAGCRQRILCSPPRRDGTVDPALLYTARQLGISEIHKAGGAQAIAAMAFGTESIPRCDKLFGPGNSWVTEAKRQVGLAGGGPAIDMPAGPSEVLVIADECAEPERVAADLLSQAEHGADSQVLLVTDCVELVDSVQAELQRQLEALPRADIARRALSASRAILVRDMQQAVAVSNAYAPEHLILDVCEPRTLLEAVENAGSVFLGPWSPEAAGDYCSGTNHVLPTYGHARAWSGLSVSSFQKQITVQELTAAGLRTIGRDAVALAEAEGLMAHANAVTCRLSSGLAA